MGSAKANPMALEMREMTSNSENPGGRILRLGAFGLALLFLAGGASGEVVPEPAAAGALELDAPTQDALTEIRPSSEALAAYADSHADREVVRARYAALFTPAATEAAAIRAASANALQDTAPPAGKPAKPDTGNDPRDFSGKVMPYYRFNKLSNGMETSDFTLFGFWAWSKVWGMTYEVPLARRYDITGTKNCAGLDEGIPCFGEVGGGGTPEVPRGFPAEGDGVEVGMGDSIFRLQFNTKANFLGSPLILGADMNLSLIHI